MRSLRSHWLTQDVGGLVSKHGWEYSEHFLSTVVILSVGIGHRGQIMIRWHEKHSVTTSTSFFSPDLEHSDGHFCHFSALLFGYPYILRKYLSFFLVVWRVSMECGRTNLTNTHCLATLHCHVSWNWKHFMIIWSVPNKQTHNPQIEIKICVFTSVKVSREKLRLETLIYMSLCDCWKELILI